MKLNFNGKEIELTQEAYPTSGSFPVDGGASYNGSWYEAVAEDDDENQYMVHWTSVAWDAEEDMCDWETPDYIREI
jgi:hypothetical protein